MSIGRSTYVLWENEVSKLEASQTDALRGRVKKVRAELESEMKRSPGWTNNLASKLDGILSVLGEPLDFTSATELGSRSGQSLLKQELDFKGWPAEAMMTDFTPAPPIRAASYINLKSTELIKETASDLKAKILDEVSKGLLLGQGTTAIMDRVLGTGLQGLAGRGGAFRGAGFRAEAIARTTVNEAFNAAANSVYEEVGSTFPDLNLKREWVAQVDNRTSQRCKSLDGKVVGQGELFVATDGWTGLLPPAHPFCRSRVVAVVSPAPPAAKTPNPSTAKTPNTTSPNPSTAKTPNTTSPNPSTSKFGNFNFTLSPTEPDPDTDFSVADKWSGSWKSAPPLLKRFVKLAPPPKPMPEVMITPGSGSFHWVGRIHMETKLKPGEPSSYSSSVYRHEYGHYMDRLLPDLVAESIVKKELTDLGFKGNLSGFFNSLKRAKKNPDKLARLQDLKTKLFTKYQVDEQASEFEVVGAVKAAVFKYAPDVKTSYISSSTEFAKAIRNDETQLYGKGLFKVPANQDELLEKYKDEPYIKPILAKNDPNALASALVVLDKLRTFEANVRNRIEGAGKTASPSTLGKIVREGMLKKVPPDSQKLAHKLWNSLSNDAKNKINNYWVAEMLVNPDSPTVVIRLAEEVLSPDRIKNPSTPMYGIVNDLAGSMTLNKIGGGHTDQYYKDGGVSQQNTETFANLNSIYGSGHPLANDILEFFVPSTFKTYKGLLGE